MAPFAHLPSWPDDRSQIVKRIVGSPGYLKIVLKIRDELHFLTEWLAHHAAIVGYENIIIFDNKSADPQLADFYRSLPDEVIVARYHTLHNFIHKTEEFPELYDALEKSCTYFAFLDCDEYLIHVADDLIVRRSEIVDILKDGPSRAVFPGVWLDNGVCSRTIYRCDTSHYLGQMLYAGKPIIRADAGISGWKLHNHTINESMYDRDYVPQFFVQHRMSLFPQRRIESNITKMIAESLIPEGWPIDRILSHDFSAIRDPGVHRYIRDIKRFLEPHEPASLAPGTMDMKVGRPITFFGAAERDAFLEFRHSEDVNFVDRYLGAAGAKANASGGIKAPLQPDLAAEAPANGGAGLAGASRVVAYGAANPETLMSNAARNDIIKMLWRGQDPFVGFPSGLYKPDPQGWNHAHPYFGEAIEKYRPRVMVEVGVWKGASSIAMANRMKELGIEGSVISVDTWLGSVEHWTDPTWFQSLVIEHGQPMLMRTFMTNVVAAGAQDVIVPLPLDSLGAAETLRRYGVQIDVLHIDAGHEYGSVISDLKAWWPLLRSGGLLIGDDYYPEGPWPGLRQAFEEFFGEMGLSAPLENRDAKCRIVKP